MTGTDVIENEALRVLPPPPYGEGALDPTISANTFGVHYGKHHKGYFDTLNKLIAATEHDLADRIAWVARGALINCAGTPGVVLRHMRGHADLTAVLDEISAVVGLVGPYG